MLPYEIVRIGIPIKREHITDEFLEVLTDLKSNPETIGVVTTSHSPGSKEYENAPAGGKLLLGHTLHDCSFIWTANRDPKVAILKLVEHLNSLHAELNFKKVYMFAAGSPNYSDSITLMLRQLCPITVIDSPSSVDLAIAEMKKVLGDVEVDIRNYHYDFIIKDNKYVDSTKLGVWSCLQQGYEVNGKCILEMFFNDTKSLISDDAYLIGVNIGEEKNTTIITTVGEVKKNISRIYNYPKSLIIGTYEIPSIKKQQD
jgi:hypothetical protein